MLIQFKIQTRAKNLLLLLLLLWRRNVQQLSNSPLRWLAFPLALCLCSPHCTPPQPHILPRQEFSAPRLRVGTRDPGVPESAPFAAKASLTRGKNKILRNEKLCCFHSLTILALHPFQAYPTLDPLASRAPQRSGLGCTPKTVTSKFSSSLTACDDLLLRGKRPLSHYDCVLFIRPSH